MVDKKLEDISKSDLQALIDNRVSEGKTIEYKKELPTNTDSSKKEFLADVTSFANTSGGDLIFGIEEDSTTREPSNLFGLEVSSIDEERTRLDNIIRTGVEPRLLNVAIKSIPLSNSRYALLIRISRSWNGPHRVTIGGHAKFYARNSSGKYEMDVDELRVAFNLSETIIERIRNFSADRIAKISVDETPVPLYSPHRIVLHLIHGNAFNPSVKVDLRSVYSNRHDKLKLLNGHVENGRYNLDGLFTSSAHKTYTQLHRNGIIEAVDSGIMRPARDGRPNLIPSSQFEKKVIQATKLYLNLMSELTIEPPLFVFMSLLNVKNFKILTRDRFEPYSEGTIDRDMLLLPAEIIESYDVRIETILKPIFDLIWNACGEPQSENFDENGNWISED